MAVSKARTLDFASLTAADHFTAHAMTRTIDLMFDQSREDLKHYRTFIRRQAGPLAPLRSSAPSPEPEIRSGYTTEADLPDDDVVSLEKAPCYVLSLEDDSKVQDPAVGWWFGCGDDEPEADPVDLLIPPSRSSAKPVYQRHGHFAFGPSHSSALYIHARHKCIRVNGESLKPHRKVQLGKKDRISIGPFQFIFEFILLEKNERAFQDAKTLNFANFRGEEPPSPGPSKTPSSKDLIIDNWVFHGIIGATASSVIQSATYKKTGEVAAVKRLSWQKKQGPHHEIELYKSIQEAVSSHRYAKFVMQFHSVLSQQTPYPEHQEAYLLWKPLARFDFESFGHLGEHEKADRELKKYLFVQILLGVLALHESNWFHRDLKPANLGVVQLGDEPYAVILDEGHAGQRQSSGYLPQVACYGTLGWQAPELETTLWAATYDERVDIWSLGAVAFFLFINPTIPWMSNEHMWAQDADPGDAFSIFSEWLLYLTDNNVNTLEYLISEMIDPNPSLRPSIPQILAHPEFKDIRAAIDEKINNERTTGQKRRARN